MEYYCKCPNCSHEIPISEIKVYICPICGMVVHPKKLTSHQNIKNKKQWR